VTEQQVTGGAPYQGEDRRHRRPAVDSPVRRDQGALVASALLLLLTAAVFIGGALLAPSQDEVLTTGVEPLLNAGAVALAIIVGLLSFVRWRLIGQACSLWIAGAALLYGTVTIPVGHLFPVILADEPMVLMWLHPASRLVVIVLLALGLRAPVVDADLTPTRVIGIAVAGTTVVTVLFQLVPSLGRALAGAHDLVASERAAPTGSALLITVFLVLAAGYVQRGARTDRPIMAWYALLLVALAFAEALRLLPEDIGWWGLGDELLRLAGLLAAVAGATRDLVNAYGEQGGRLLESVATGATAEARIRAEAAASEERAHEARNALAAIEGATKTLERYRDRLDAASRAQLTEAISGEIARLQALVSVERARGAGHPFLVSRALRHVVAGARSNGMVLEVDIDAELKAFGHGAETAEVVQNLLVNARRYAPGSPVRISGERRDGGVIIRVDDRGPGVAESERRLIFTRGTRGRAAEQTFGSGLGLYVSLELMREQSGDLWVEEREGGGASFVCWLPAVSEPDEDDDDHGIVVRDFVDRDA
jgi:signal transduction histidine kinase